MVHADAVPAARGESRKSLSKAEEMLAVAADAAAAARWNAAALNAIHAGICAADAALISSAGFRSRSQDHSAVMMFLEKEVAEFGASQRRQIAGLLKMKNKVEYEQRLLTETEARQLVDQADRFVRWAKSVVSTHLDR